MILIRLINVDKVVGAEKHEDGHIYHKNWIGGRWWNILHIKNVERPHGVGVLIEPKNTSYIPHDRKDLFTGIEIDGEKVFERDEVMQVGTRAGMSGWVSEKDEMCVVKYIAEQAKYMAIGIATAAQHNLDELLNPKITGILGVTP